MVPQLKAGNDKSMQHTNIVILTGAGISAESGLSTFRDGGGLWDDHRIEDVATPEAFARNPALVQRFYNIRRAQLKSVQPNAAHIALAHLVAQWKGRVTIITQNVDDLHERAMTARHCEELCSEAIQKTGSPRPDGLAMTESTLLHMHGELKKARCSLSEEVFAWEEDIEADTKCPCCKKTGRLRPHIVWFGEMPLHMDVIYHLLGDCDLFLSIGTSGNVYPAAGFVQEVRRHGRAHTVEINMEPSGGHTLFHEKRYGKAGEILPGYIDNLLKNND